MRYIYISGDIHQIMIIEDVLVQLHPDGGDLLFECADILDTLEVVKVFFLLESFDFKVCHDQCDEICEV